MKKVVISQPMFFPWIGMFEQIRLADVYIHYDDAQFPHGYGNTFINRVQIKTADGIQWLTVPVVRKGIHSIKDTLINESSDWRKKHLKTLYHAYGKCSYYTDLRDIVEDVYAHKCLTISELNIYALLKVCAYFSISTQFKYSSCMPIGDIKSSEKVLALVKACSGDVYITGWGAKNYLDHALFEQNNIQVEYMDYQKKPYNQKFGEFTPYVSILDLIANKGTEGREVMISPTMNWRNMLMMESL